MSLTETPGIPRPNQIGKQLTWSLQSLERGEEPKLSLLFRQILLYQNISNEMFSQALKRFVERMYPDNNLAESRERTVVKLTSELCNPDMSWGTFCTGLAIIDYKNLTITVDQ